MVIRNLILAVPVAIAWMVLINRVELASFLIGYVLGLALLALLRPNLEVKPARIPGQLVALAIYAARLARDIVLSSIDVTRRLLSPGIPFNQGIVAVSVADEAEVIAALSAHSITITPGEMVVDFDEEAHLMYVHVLDVGRSTDAKLAQDQQERLSLLRRVIGRD